jgi:hypothetical protein
VNTARKIGTMIQLLPSVRCEEDDARAVSVVFAA